MRDGFIYMLWLHCHAMAPIEWNYVSGHDQEFSNYFVECLQCAV